MSASYWETWNRRRATRRSFMGIMGGSGLLLAGAGCALGMTTRAGLVRDLRSPLELPRLDTNDLPKRRDADPNEWTMHAIGLETEMTPVTGPRPRWSRDG